MKISLVSGKILSYIYYDVYSDGIFKSMLIDVCKYSHVVIQNYLKHVIEVSWPNQQLRFFEPYNTAIPLQKNMLTLSESSDELLFWVHNSKSVSEEVQSREYHRRSLPGSSSPAEAESNCHLDWKLSGLHSEHWRNDLCWFLSAFPEWGILYWSVFFCCCCLFCFVVWFSFCCCCFLFFLHYLYPPPPSSFWMGKYMCACYLWSRAILPPGQVIH